MSIITVNSSNLSELKAFVLGMQTVGQAPVGPQLYGQPGYGYPSQGVPSTEQVTDLLHFPVGKAYPVKVTKGESDPSYSVSFPIYDGFRQDIKYDLVDGALFTRD